MYFHGAFFHDSYLRALGAPPDLFRLPFEEILLQGFTAYMLIGLPALIILTMYLLLALGVAYNLNEASKISFIKLLVNWVSINLKAINFKNDNPGHHFTENTIKVISKILVIVILLLILFGATVWLAYKADNLGKENAKNNLIWPEKAYKLQYINIKNGYRVRGYALQCSNYGCVILSNKRIQIIPLEKIDSFNQ